MGRGWLVAEFVPVPAWNVMLQIPGSLNFGLKIYVSTTPQKNKKIAFRII